MDPLAAMVVILTTHSARMAAEAHLTPMAVAALVAAARETLETQGVLSLIHLLVLPGRSHSQ